MCPSTTRLNFDNLNVYRSSLSKVIKVGCVHVFIELSARAHMDNAHVLCELLVIENKIYVAWHNSGSQDIKQ